MLQNLHECLTGHRFVIKKEHMQLFSMALPGLVLLIIFHYLPMFGIILGFKKFKYNLGVFRSPWCGLENFRFFFKSGSLVRLMRNTVGMNLLFLLTGTSLNVVLALLLYEITNRRAIRLYQTVIFLPFVISWVAASYAVYANFSDVDGIINHMRLAMGREKIMWYGSPNSWPVILLVSFLWKSTGFGMIVNYGNLLTIDHSYYEAAQLDGANRLQMMRYISIPFIRPIVMTMFILSLGKVFNADFGMFYYLPRNSSMLYSTTDVIDTFVYRALRVTGDVGMSSAVGLCQSVVGFILLMACNKVTSRFSDRGGFI